MHVCMISDEYGVFGGLQNAVLEISKALINTGVQVTIYNSYSQDSTFFQDYAFECVRPYRLLPAKLQFAYYEKYAYNLRVWRKIRHRSFDIIHSHADNGFFPALLRNRTPLVANIHGIKKAARSKLSGPNSLAIKSPRSFPMFWPEEIAAKRSDVVVACSNAERADLISVYGINPAKIKVIHHGIDLEKFKPTDKQTARKILGLPADSKYAIWVGNNPELKGLNIAIEAVKNIKNLRLLVVGASGNDFDNVYFYGPVFDLDKLRTLYNAADFLIFPTIYEGFGLVVLEALACGLPVIISKECPAGEIIRDGVEGYIVDKRNPQLYAEKISVLLKNLQSNQVSQACRHLAEQHSWQKVGQKYFEVYKQLIR